MTNRKQAVFGRLVCGLVAVLTALMLLPVRASHAAAEGDVAQIGTTTYATLDEAVEQAAEGATITLLQDCELTKGFNKTLTFTGGHKITINKQLTSNGEGWMCFGLYDPTRVLTFDDVTVQWNSEVGTAPWLMLSLSGTMNVTNGADVSFVVDSGSTGNRNAIYMNAGSVINVSNNSKFTIYGNQTDGKEGQGIQLDKAGTANVNVTGESTFTIDGTNRGYVNSPSIYVKDSTFIVQNCTSNASNGGEFTAINSHIIYQDNNGHGLSAGTALLTIQNSILDCNRNAYYGITYSGDMKMDSTSVINANGNGYGYTGGGIRAYGTSTVEAGAEINVLNNARNGIENYGSFTISSGANANGKETIFTVTGNNEPSRNGGGIYNGGTLSLPDTAIIMNNHAAQTGGGICNAGTVTIPAGVQLYNNHADNAGDDILSRSGSSLTFSEVGTDWILDDCDDRIDGWYDDAAGSRWNAHAEKAEDNHIVLYPNTEQGESYTITSLKALKAAHDNVPDVEPALDKTSNGADAIGQVTAGSVIPFEVSISVPTVGGNLTVTDQMSNMTFNNDLTLNNRTVEYTALDSSFSLTIPGAYRGQTVVLRYSGTIVSSAKAGDTVSNTAYFDGNHDTVLGTVKADEGIGHNDPYLKVNKLWTGDDDSAVRPSSIQVNVYHEEDLYKTITIYERYKWMGGTYIPYEWKDDNWWVEEVDVPADYDVTVSEPNHLVFDITNDYDAPEVVVEESSEPSEPAPEPSQPSEYIPEPSEEPAPSSVSSSEPSSEPSEPSEPTLPQTGQLWWPVPVLLIAGAVIVAVGAFKARRHGRRDR